MASPKSRGSSNALLNKSALAPAVLRELEWCLQIPGISNMFALRNLCALLVCLCLVHVVKGEAHIDYNDCRDVCEDDCKETGDNGEYPNYVGDGEGNCGLFGGWKQKRRCCANTAVYTPSPPSPPPISTGEHINYEDCRNACEDDCKETGDNGEYPNYVGDGEGNCLSGLPKKKCCANKPPESTKEACQSNPDGLSYDGYVVACGDLSAALAAAFFISPLGTKSCDDIWELMHSDSIIPGFDTLTANLRNLAYDFTNEEQMESYVKSQCPEQCDYNCAYTTSSCWCHADYSVSGTSAATRVSVQSFAGILVCGIILGLSVMFM